MQGVNTNIAIKKMMDYNTSINIKDFSKPQRIFKLFYLVFQACDTYLILATTPKAGTIWFKALTFALLKRNKYPNIYNNDHPLLTTNPHALVPYLELNLYIKKHILPQLNSTQLNSFSSPRLFSTLIAKICERVNL